MNLLKRCLFFILMVLMIPNVYAASISIKSSAATVTVGSTVSITISSDDIMGSYTLYSSNKGVLEGGDENTIDSGDAFSKTYIFTAKSVGKAIVTFSPKTTNSLRIFSTEQGYNESRSVTINVVNKANGSSSGAIDVNPTYNKNNYLSSLSIDGYELDPSFDKDTLEYKVTLKPGTETINISAETEDDKATVKGIGEIAVSEGINTIDVTVVAENGNERIYKIIATLEEKDPVKVKIGKNNYTVVKNKELLGSRDGYSQTTIKIDGIEVPALYNEVTKITLVALKDKDGKISFYSYDTKTGEYTEYEEFTFDLMNLYIHEDTKSKYQKIELKINGKKVVAYKLDGIKDYYLLYATNTSTGYEGYYLYDKVENSVQRYDTTLLDKITEEKDKYLSIVIVLSSVCFLAMLFLLIQVNRYNKRNG